uniref:Uncharacterized protein n=1 Tax=Aegilops tauschii subsp. strangulata TaxID=200361 RepID=A0A453BR94_AEGTS
VAYIEASAVIYQDGKILIEVDHLQGVTNPYIQIKGTNKEIVSSAASSLSLDGSYTTKVLKIFSLFILIVYVHSAYIFHGFIGALQSYLQIILESLPVDDNVTAGIHNQQAARLQELVEFIQSQMVCLMICNPE